MTQWMKFSKDTHTEVPPVTVPLTSLSYGHILSRPSCSWHEALQLYGRRPCLPWDLAAPRCGTGSEVAQKDRGEGLWQARVGRSDEVQGCQWDQRGGWRLPVCDWSPLSFLLSPSPSCQPAPLQPLSPSSLTSLKCSLISLHSSTDPLTPVIPMLSFPLICYKVQADALQMYACGFLMAQQLTAEEFWSFSLSPLVLTNQGPVYVCFPYGFPCYFPFPMRRKAPWPDNQWTRRSHLPHSLTLSF